MAIRKRNKVWEIDYTDITGKRVRQSGYKTKQEAEIALSEAKVNKAKGITNVINKAITIKEAGTYFIEKYAKFHCKEKSIDEYNRIVYKTIIPYFQNMKLINLKKSHVEDFICHLQNIKNNSASTINKTVFILGAIVEKQIENGHIFQNVVRKLKKLKANESNAKSLTQEEIEILLKTCLEHKPNFYPILLTALTTGMRRGEIVALMWENVDLKNNKIYVKYSEYNGKLLEPKTKSSYRGLNIPANLRKVLVEQKLKIGTSKFVFPKDSGEMMSAHNISSRTFPSLIKKANIGHFRFHDLRHTFGSQLINNGVNIKYVQNQMGHSKIKTTLDVYGHLLPDSNPIAMDVLNKIYSIAN